MKLGKTIGASLVMLAVSTSSAEGQDSIGGNEVNRCVLQLLDNGANELEAIATCGLSPDLEITRLPGGEICIMPKKAKVVDNMTEIPDDEKEKGEKEDTKKPEENESIPVS